MRPIRTVFLFLLFLISIEIDAQVTFQRTIGGIGNDHGRAIVVCSSGGYLVVGGTNSFINPSSDMYIVRIDDEGDFLWGKNIGYENHIEWASDVIETEDGSFLIAGYTDNTDGKGYDGMLVKIDSEGNQLWSFNFGGADWDFFEAIETDEFENIYLGGITYSQGGRRAWLLKLDDNGAQVWENTIPELPDGGIYDMHPCSDGSFVFTGNTENPFTNERRAIGGRFDLDGIVYWHEVFEEFGDAEGRACTCTDGELKLVGNSFEAFGPDVSDILIAGFDLINANFLWFELITADADDLGMGIGFKETGNLLICGARSTVGDGMRDAYFTEYGSSGEFLGPGFGWTDGGSEDDLLYDIVATPDGGFVAVGETNSFGNNSQVYAIKVNADSESIPENIDFLDLATDVAELKAFRRLNPYPNPAQNQVQFDMPSAVQFEIALYSSTSQLAKKAQITGNEPLDISDLEPGVYVFQIRFGNDYFQDKLIILPN